MLRAPNKKLDLARVVEAVVSSLREADEVVQSAIAAVSASRGGLTDKARVDLTDRLEASARGIEESIKGQSSFVARNRPLVTYSFR